MHRKPNPLAFDKPITMETLDELFSHHRSLTGGWSMTATPPEPSPPAPTPPAPAAPPAPTPPPAAYTPPATQDDLNRIVGERLAREREKYADYEALKEKAAAHDQALEAAMTDAEKAVALARKEGETTATERANARIIGAEARALAAAEKFRNPVAAVKLLDLSGVTVGDDGEVDADAIKAKLKALGESDPYLLDDGKKPAPKPDPTQGGSGSGDKGRLGDLSGSDLYDRLHPKKAS